MKRESYRRRLRKWIWHFEAVCRFWPTKGYREEKSRPNYGTLCDYCQNIERRKDR